MWITTNPMIKEIKNQNISHKAFTLIEMVIVLIIMGIILMMTVALSWHTIHKIEDKAVKESILSEFLSRYSRNLWSSSFGWVMYDTMDIKLTNGGSKIDFVYNPRNGEDNIENTFTNNFEIKYITTNYKFEWNPSSSSLEGIELKYSPYKITCEIWEDENNENVIIVTRVNDRKDYCFEINQKNCRLVDVSEENCSILVWLAWIK